MTPHLTTIDRNALIHIELLKRGRDVGEPDKNDHGR